MAQFKGDADNDGKITVLDLPLALKVASGLAVDQDTIDRLDVDGDGVVTISDVDALYKHINAERIIDGVIY